MKNYKNALFDAISDNVTARENLGEYSRDFINDNDATDSAYICDAISNFADNNTSIYFYDIMEYIKGNPDDVNDAINEFGLDGCGCDIYKAGQMAEYLAIEREIYDDLENIIKHIAINFIDSTDEADDEAEAIWESLTEEERDEITADFLDGLENIDNNSRLDEIADLYAETVQAILSKADDESNDGAEV